MLKSLQLPTCVPYYAHPGPDCQVICALSSSIHLSAAAQTAARAQHSLLVPLHPQVHYVLDQQLNKERCLFWVCYPQDRAAVACGCIISTSGEAVTNMKNLTRIASTQAVCSTGAGRLDLGYACNKIYSSRLQCRFCFLQTQC
jgi:hypothetical protein